MYFSDGSEMTTSADTVYVKLPAEPKFYTDLNQAQNYQLELFAKYINSHITRHISSEKYLVHPKGCSEVVHVEPVGRTKLHQIVVDQTGPICVGKHWFSQELQTHENY